MKPAGNGSGPNSAANPPQDGTPDLCRPEGATLDAMRASSALEAAWQIEALADTIPSDIRQTDGIAAESMAVRCKHLAQAICQAFDPSDDMREAQYLVYGSTRVGDRVQRASLGIAVAAEPAREEDKAPTPLSARDLVDTLAQHRSYASSFLALQQILVDLHDGSGPFFPSDANDPGSLYQLGYALRRALKFELDGVERIERALREADHV